MGNPHRDRERRRNRDNFGNHMQDAFERYGRIDVSVDGQHDERRRYDSGRTQHDDNRPQRPRLEFTELVCLEQGDCRCRITSAQGHNGRIFNFTVERQNRDRTTRFFRDSDATDLTLLIKRSIDWIEANRS